MPREETPQAKEDRENEERRLGTMSNPPWDGDWQTRCIELEARVAEHAQTVANLTNRIVQLEIAIEIALTNIEGDPNYPETERVLRETVAYK